MPFFKSYPPPVSLKSIIREFQIYHANWNEEKDLPPPFITCLANTEQNLYIYLNDEIKVVPAEKVEIPAPKVIVTGPKFKPVGLLFGKDHFMIKVAFHPTGTFRLLGINMEKTVNTGLDATTFWGNEILEVISILKEKNSYDEVITEVISFIEKKFDNNCRPEEPIDLIAIQMSDPSYNNTLEEWACKACLSIRQFERNFKTRVGISPKLFIRIVRFGNAMCIKNKYPDKSWSEIALEAGYTDSSHILREFKEFAEFPPSDFYLKPTSGFSEFPTG
ncbi:MAG TPA: AraC family transcriptional regulator [Hanamia sp.]|nr:AraC family transcriptional regulator [Hanamia sp.]